MKPLTMHDVSTFQYHEALTDLSRKAREFAHAMIRAAELARVVGGDCDDLLAISTFQETRAALVEGFTRAPGMLSIFAGKVA